MKPSIKGDGLEEIKSVTGYSIEKELEGKKFFLEEGTFNFWNPADPDDTVLGRALEVCPGWSVGYVAPSLIGRYRTFDQYDLVLFCYECGGAPVRQLLAEAAPADGKKRKIAIVTGAEGGFAAEEAEMAAKAGAKTVGLGPRILRCETAPLAVLSAVMTLTGNLE